VTRILIVEDEPDLVVTLEEDLRRQGYETVVARDGREAVRLGTKEPWDMVLLDVMLPGLDGFDVCASLRRAGVTTPIIMLTARSGEADKEVGLDAGADDYVTKPFGMRELRARIRARLRRHEPSQPRRLQFGECEIDFDRAELWRQGARLAVTPQELRMLEVFARNPGRVLITDRAVDTHVFNLRKKVEANPGSPRCLVGVRGLGYRFDA
jgi:DNA-binding response OmpR family regulator